MILAVSEIVSCIQPEGLNYGFPTTYVNLHGCRLSEHCSSNQGSKKRMSIHSVLPYIFKMGNKHVDIAGGEPLAQDATHVLLYELVSREYIVTLHTNGTMPIDFTTYNRSYTYLMEVQCPSSKNEHLNLYNNLACLQGKDAVKFSIRDAEDYIFAKNVLKRYPTKATKIFVPDVVDNDNQIETDLALWLLSDKITGARMNIKTKQVG